MHEMPHHPGVTPSPGPVDVAIIVVLAVTAATYVSMTLVQHRRGRRWPWHRTASFLIGVAVAVWAMSGRWLPFVAGSLPHHMLRHLMIGMYAPLGLVLGAPLTLTLRTLPRRSARRVGAALRRRPVRALVNPAVAVAFVVGGLVALYFTPLHAWVMEHPVGATAVDVHFLLAGCLFAAVIAGPDPLPHRRSTTYRLVTVGVAVTAHAVIAQLVYGGVWVRVAATVAERRVAGDLMYYGGDVAELLLAVGVMATWHPRHLMSKVREPIVR